MATLVLGSTDNVSKYDLSKYDVVVFREGHNSTLLKGPFTDDNIGYAYREVSSTGGYKKV